MRKYAKQDYDQVSGIFTTYDDLMNVTEALSMRGVPKGDISIMMSEDAHQQFIHASEGTKAPEGATIGGISGGILGALIGSLTLLGNLVAPGIGILAAGPAVGALAGSALGAATGSIIGALIGMGIPEHEAVFYEDALKQPNNALLVTHVPHEAVGEIKSLFERFGVHSLKVHHS